MKRKEGRTPPPRGGAPRARPQGDYADPYKPARRPRPAGDAGAPLGRQRPARGGTIGGGFGGGRAGGITVALDPDVARVFRGDASVNKALRLVMQLMQVAQGPPRGFGSRAERPEHPRRGGYQGSAEARGFARKPRFEEDEQ
jgi:hypothetical protein